jgi:hypothetical protein
VVDPTRYLNNIQPVVPPSPPLKHLDKRVGKPSPFGETTSLEMIGSVVPYVETWKALDGWRGGLAQPFSRFGNDCMAIATAFDTPAHAAAFTTVATKWADASIDANVTQAGSSVNILACDPGPDASLPPPPPPTALQVLQTRAAFIQAMTQASNSITPTVAACAADRTIEQLGPPAFVQLADTPAAQIPPNARQALAQAGAACRPAS